MVLNVNRSTKLQWKLDTIKNCKYLQCILCVKYQVASLGRHHKKNQPNLWHIKAVTSSSDVFLLHFSFENPPSSIHSCSIDYILEHEFCHLGCWAPLWAVSEEFLKRRNFCLSMLLFGMFFLCFHGQKNIFSKNFLHCSVRTEKLHKIKYFFLILGKKIMIFK